MTDYNLIFGLVLIFNIAVTFRASSYWKKYFPDASSANNNDNNNEEEMAPLSSGKDDDVEKGQASSNSAASDAAANIRHSQLLKKYLFVYLLAAFSDWLQGPYVYALYDAYGYTQHEIAVLFVAGFGSSMVFGSFIGGMADQGGRKRFVILFAVIYALSCMTKREYLFMYYYVELICVFVTLDCIYYNLTLHLSRHTLIIQTINTHRL